MKNTDTAYVCLGSNHGDSGKILQKALEMCSAVPQTAVTVASGVYLTEPWGDRNQPWFYNQVAALETALEPKTLLTHMQRIENSLGRVRTERRYGPRTLDLDLLLHGGRVVEDDFLTLPHPRMRLRAFVLVPLLEVAPDLLLPPDGATLAGVLDSLDYVIKGDKIYQKD